MKKLLPLFLAVLCVALLGTSLLLWQKLGDARAATDRIAAARSALEAQVASLEKRERTLQSEATALRQQSTGPARGGRQQPQNAAAGPTPMRGGPMQALETPEMRRLMAVEQKGRLDNRYAALFKSLKLPPEQLDKLKQLLVDKQSAPMDVFAEARAQGMVGPESRAQIQELLKSTNQEIEDNLHTALGDTAYSQYQHYEQTQSQRGLVDQLSSRLSYTDAPLSTAQAEQLVALLAANSAATSGDGANSTFTFAVGGPGGGPPMMMGGPGGGTTITNEAIAAAQATLSSSQVEALRQLQAEQQAQQQMAQTMRQNFGPPGGNGTVNVISGPGGTTTTTTTNARPPNG